MRAISLLGALTLVSTVAAVGCEHHQSKPPSRRHRIGRARPSGGSRRDHQRRQLHDHRAERVHEGRHDRCQPQLRRCRRRSAASRPAAGSRCRSAGPPPTAARSWRRRRSSFNVVAGQTTPVSVHLLCHETPRTGSVLVNGTLNVCPLVDGVSASPPSLRRRLGGLSGDRARQRRRPVGAQLPWTATSGRRRQPDGGRAPSFSCTAPGSVTITVSASDGDPAADLPAASRSPSSAPL